MSSRSNRTRSLFFISPRLPVVFLLLWCSSLAGCCPTCTPCIRPQLQVEAPPVVRRVEIHHPSSPLAEYCLTDRGRKDVHENLEACRAAWEAATKTIQLYNDEISRKPGNTNP